MTQPNTTQRDRVLALMLRPEGACMISFVHHGILRYSARIFELRELGFTIETEPCDRTDHHGHDNYRATRYDDDELEYVNGGPR